MPWWVLFLILSFVPDFVNGTLSLKNIVIAVVVFSLTNLFLSIFCVILQSPTFSFFLLVCSHEAKKNFTQSPKREESVDIWFSKKVYRILFYWQILNEWLIAKMVLSFWKPATKTCISIIRNLKNKLIFFIDRYTKKFNLQLIVFPSIKVD